MQQMQQAQQQDGPKPKVVQFILFTARSGSAALAHIMVVHVVM